MRVSAVHVAAVGAVLAMSATSIGPGAHAQTPATVSAPSAPCSAPEYRQFDFWLGKWNAYDRLAKTPGTSVIESLYNGCGFRESWSEDGLTGGSINAYLAADGKWHQIWVDNRGGIREFVGGPDAQGRMVMIARFPSQRMPGRQVWDRMTFSKEPDGRVRQYSDASTDEGATWTPLYDNIYTRAD